MKTERKYGKTTFFIQLFRIFIRLFRTKEDSYYSTILSVYINV